MIFYNQIEYFFLGSIFSRELRTDVTSNPIVNATPDVSCLCVYSGPQTLERLGNFSDLRNNWTYTLVPLFMRIDGSVLEYIQSRQKPTAIDIRDPKESNSAEELSIIFNRGTSHRYMADEFSAYYIIRCITLILVL